MSDDDDKTVFGQGLPPQNPGRPAPRPTPPAADPGGERTVFGVPIRPAGGGPGRAVPHVPQNQPGPGVDDTWLGGGLQPGGPRSPAPQYNAPQYSTPQYRPQSLPTGADMFPDIQPVAPAPVQSSTPRIALEDALKGTGAGQGGSSNPLIRSAANLLILLGRLRTGLVELRSDVLNQHVAREIELFEHNAMAAGVSPQDVRDAKYALSATADDIVQNLPEADRTIWVQYAMVARFFGERDSGIGFFRKMDEAMKAPAQRFHLLEMMLTCLSLGFEGQYRTMSNGAVDLARARSAIYESLRRVQARPTDDVSVNWMAVPLSGGRRYGGTPVWAVAGISAGMVVALFATLSTLLSYRGAEAREAIVALHEGLPPVIIERTAAVIVPYVPPASTQLERIREALAPEIEQGRVAVEEKGEYILVRVGNYLRFGSGSAELVEDFTPLAQEIAEMLDTETGPIRVVGHTDSIPPSGRGRYRTNEELSVARAETVGAILAGLIADPTRIATEGQGDVDPIADNETPEGREANRRVEVMIPKETAT